MMDFIISCVTAKGSDIQDMIDAATQVKFETVAKHTGGLRYLNHLFEYTHPNLTIKSDYAVSFWKSKYKGRACYFIRSSGIEYVFA